MRRTTRLTLLAFVLLAVASGCAKPRSPIPAVEWDGDVAQARRVLIERARCVRTVSATGLLTLTRPDGESVRFDAALVTEPPDRLRLRAWKIGRAVFDLTLTPDGLWLLSPREESLQEKAKKAGVGAGEVAKQWSLLSGAFFEREDLVASLSGRSLILTGPQDQLTIRAYIDRRTLVPRRYVLHDDRGRERFSLRLDDYRMIGDTPYPHRALAESESGRIRIQLDEVELNAELAPGAFTPPRRAEKIDPS
jgi:hypothetical protein